MFLLSKSVLAVAIVLLPFSYIKLVYNFSVSDMLFCFAFLFAIAHQLKSGKKIKNIFNDNIFLLPIIIYSIGFFISIDSSLNPIDGLFSFLQIIFMFTIIFYALKLNKLNESFIYKLVYFYSIISILIAFVILLYFFTGIDYSYGLFFVKEGWGMVRFTYGNMEPNITARIMVQSAPILMLFIFKNKNLFLKFLNILLFVLLVLVIILTGSRSGLILLLVGLFLFSLFSYRKNQRYDLMKIMIFFIILFFSMSKFYSSYNETFDIYLKRYYTIFNPNTSDSSQERLFVLEKSLNFINDDPIVGLGLGNSDNLTGMAVHNSIIISWLENGIFGFLGFLMIYLIMIYYVLINYKHRFFDSNILMVLSIIVIMMVLGDMFMPTSYKRSLWVIPIMFIVYSNYFINKLNSYKNES